MAVPFTEKILENAVQEINFSRSSPNLTTNDTDLLYVNIIHVQFLELCVNTLRFDAHTRHLIYLIFQKHCHYYIMVQQFLQFLTISLLQLQFCR